MYNPPEIFYAILSLSVKKILKKDFNFNLNKL